MKRIWFAGIFLVLVISSCIAQQFYIKSFCDEITKEIEYAQTSTEAKDKAEFNKSIKKIKILWNNNNELLFVLANHTELNELGIKIRTLGEAGTNNFEILADAKALTKIFYENEKVSLANIF